MIFTNLNPLPLTFSKVLQYQNSIDSLFLLTIEFERNKSSGSNGCEYPQIQFPSLLIRNHLKSDDLHNFIVLVILNSMLNAESLYKPQEELDNHFKYRVKEMRKSAVSITHKLLNKATLGSIVGSDASDEEKRVINNSAVIVHDAIDCILEALPLNIRTAMPDMIDHIIPRSDNTTAKLFNIMWLDQYATFDYSDRHRMPEHTIDIMNYGLNLCKLSEDMNRSPYKYRNFDELFDHARDMVQGGYAYPFHIINMALWIKNLGEKYDGDVDIQRTIFEMIKSKSKRHLYESEKNLINDICQAINAKRIP